MTTRKSTAHIKSMRRPVRPPATKPPTSVSIAPPLPADQPPVNGGRYTITQVKLDELTKRFTYITPSTTDDSLYKDLVSQTRTLSLALCHNIKPGKPLEAALHTLDDLVYWIGMGISESSAK